MKKSVALVRDLSDRVPRTPAPERKTKKSLRHLALVDDEGASRWVKKPMRTQKEAEGIFNENMGLIFKGIKTWRLRDIRSAEWDDIVQLASISAFKSCIKWDEKQGALSTFVIANIRECRNELLENAGVIHVSRDELDKIRHYNKWRFANPEKPIESFAKKYDISVERAGQIAIFAERYAGGRHPVRMGQHAYARSIKTPQDAGKRLKAEELRRDVEITLKRLKPKERKAIELYYLEGHAGEVKTKEEVGAAMGVSATRVSQLLFRGLRKLRCSAHNKLLVPYVRAEQEG